MLRNIRNSIAPAILTALAMVVSRPTLADDGDGCVSQDVEVTKHIISNFENGGNAIYVADLDGDGDLDVVSTATIDDAIAWFENDGGSPPIFTKHPITQDADSVQAVYVADIDGDNLMDIVSASAFDDKIAWYQNDGGSPPNFTERIITETANFAQGVFAVDVDGDGNMDVLSASLIDRTVAWYENLGGSPPSFFKRVISDTANGAKGIFAIDLDRDNDIDVIAAASSLNTVFWYESNGAMPPTFTEHIITDTAANARAVFAADINGDTWLDVVVASQSDDTVAWFESDGMSPPNFTEHVLTQSANGARTVYVADLDGDLDMDIVAGSGSDDTVRMFENDGMPSPGFTEHIITVGADAVQSVFAANLDDTPELEMLSNSAANDQLAWYTLGPPTLGACCLPNTDCVENICVADCAMFSGWTWTANATCAEVTCFGNGTPAAFFVDGLNIDTFQDNVCDLAAFGTRHWSQPENLLAVDYIKEKLESFGYTNVVLDPYEFGGQPRHNVYATKVGAKRPGEMYILGAHLDSFNRNGDQTDAPGADDDGSGTASVLEMARVFARARTDVTIRFCLWNNEETGLNGSKAYVRNHEPLQGTPDEPRWLGMIQQDMILYDHGPGKIPDADVEFRAQANPSGTAEMLADFVGSAMDRYGDIPAEVTDDMANTDSASFQGSIAAISVRENRRLAEIGNGSNPHYHQPTDLCETYTEQDYQFGFNIVKMITGAVGEITGAILYGDGDGDNDVDIFDYDAFLNCFTGPGGVATPECDVFDSDGDGDVDWTDYAFFQTNFDGG